MNKTYIKAILVLLALVMVGGSYLYIFKPKQEDTETVTSEADQLEIRKNDLEEKKKHEAEYKQDIENFNKQFDEILAYYPSNLNQENIVMFVKNLNKEEGEDRFHVSGFTMPEPNGFYTLSGEETYECYSGSYPLQYTGSYEGLKAFVDYIMAYSYRMNIDNFNIGYDEAEDQYSGSINMLAYCISGGDRDADIIPINVDVPKGVKNPFLGGEGAPTTGTSSAHDSDNGASIASEHDIQIDLSNANNDATAGIVISGGSADITSAENSVVTVDITIENDKVTYGIGSDTATYDVGASATEIAIYVKSSARVDADDTNGITLNITNNSDKQAYIKVADDDAASPRFKMGSRSGSVKLY